MIKSSYPKRGSIRLKGYNYSLSGAYFVTICVHNKDCIFGEIHNSEMHVNSYGTIVLEEWKKSEQIRKEIQMGEYVIMPNHFHGIVYIHATGTVGRDRLVARSTAGLQPKSLGAFIAGFKSSVTSQINKIRNTPGSPIWQRNYYEHIIRDDDDFIRILQYIEINPAKWEIDSLNPLNVNGGITAPKKNGIIK